MVGQTVGATGESPKDDRQYESVSELPNLPKSWHDVAVGAGLALPEKGRSKRRPDSGCLLPTANSRHALSGASVSALISWHDCRRERNSETVSCAGPTQDARRYQIFFFSAIIFETPL